ncbi:hypothetical protein DKM44_02370 [Deinococcus irradiatisoli]|uniref:Uncharacterized protein n=1 Tax=Deinococcus irradiatisoli TaxID=2202254 RepID=A0A2Z3JB31_9DEIO|nr:hypothetical protein DKM44_02370 [Deinococcus irradiatisoli]
MVVLMGLASVFLLSSKRTVTPDSPPKNIQRDTTPPIIHAFQANVEMDGTVLFELLASDNVGVTLVKYYVNDQLVGTQAKAPFKFTAHTKTAGHVTPSAEVFDAAGNVATTKDDELFKMLHK